LMTIYHWLAHLVVIVHALYFSFVVGGMLAIVVGILRRWQWIRNFWFRLIHLAMMGIVGVEAVFGWACPLTDWEKYLMAQAGEESYGGDFIAHLAQQLLYWNFPPWVFTVLHISFALLVVAVFVLAPPRWPKRKATHESSATTTSPGSSVQ